MIAAKLKAFKEQIRHRSRAKKMQKIRFNNWLHNHPTYIEMAQQLLCLVARCKFHQPSPSIPAFINLLYFVEQHQADVNAYIVICQQFLDMDLVHLICEKIVDARFVFPIIQCLFVGKLEYFNAIKNQETRQAALQVHERMLFKHGSTIIQKMFKQVSNLINGGKIEIKQAALQDKLATVNRIVVTIAQVVKQQFENKYAYSENIVYLLCLQNNANILQNLSSIFEQYCYQMQTYELISYFRVYLYLMKHVGNQMQHMYKNNQEKTKSAQQIKLNLSAIVLDTFNNVIAKNNSKIKTIVQKQYQLCQSLLQILLLAQIDSAKYYQLVHFCICSYSNLAHHKKQSQRLIKNLDYGRQIQCVRLLHQLSYYRQWLYYQHVRQYILKLLWKIRVAIQVRPQIQPTNIFYRNKPQSTNYAAPEQHSSAQIDSLIIKLLCNVILNEQSRNCSYDYYETLQYITQDILSTEMLQIWCTYQKTAENMAYLIRELLNVKDQDLKIRVVRSCLLIIDEQSMRCSNYHCNSYKERHQIVKKLKLYINLFGIDRSLGLNYNSDDQYRSYYEDYSNQSQQSESTTAQFFDDM